MRDAVALLSKSLRKVMAANSKVARSGRMAKEYDVSQYVLSCGKCLRAVAVRAEAVIAAIELLTCGGLICARPAPSPAVATRRLPCP